LKTTFARLAVAPDEVSGVERSATRDEDAPHSQAAGLDRLLTDPAPVTMIMVMARRRGFALIYDPDVAAHLGAIEAKYHALIRSTIEEQLRFEPVTATRNRKPLERPVAIGARWELRCGPDNRFRVFYRVAEAERQVRILAIAVKERNRIFIAGREVKL
jgi:hypothetical protein